jgi:pSer/pThr/pTyr-binding forkhead associated (FHA) protein
VYLWVTFTGHRFSLPLWGEVVVGRYDPVVGFIPEIDLGEEEEAAQVVARRHVKIIARQGRHYVEDMGSANGTRLNGSPLGIGARGLLDLGDHLWLGGCVLAYDVEL